jgi:MoxR-like ATPase
MRPPSRTPSMDDADLQAAEQLARRDQQMTHNLSSVIVGQSEVLKQVLIALFCQGHCILEGCPAWRRRS